MIFRESVTRSGFVCDVFEVASPLLNGCHVMTDNRVHKRVASYLR